MEHAVRDFAAERVARPGRRIPDGHDIGMAGDHEDGSFRADAGIEVLDIGRVGGAEDRPVRAVAFGGEHGLEQR